MPMQSNLILTTLEFGILILGLLGVILRMTGERLGRNA